MSDKDIKNWEQRLTDQIKRDWNNYSRFRLDLSAARDIEPFNFTGEFLYIEQVSSNSALATIRLNRNTNSEIDLNIGTFIKTVFKEFYITNTAQAGEWIDLIIGINFEYHKQFSGSGIPGARARQVLNLTHAVADTDVAAVSQPCNSALIKADVNNTQTAWIDFNVAAVQNSAFPLDAGEWLRVKIPNTDQVHANFEVGGEIVFIVYEV